METTQPAQQIYTNSPTEEVILNDMESFRLNTPTTTKNTSLTSFSSVQTNSPPGIVSDSTAPRKPQLQQQVPPPQQQQQPTMSKNPDFLSFMHNPFDINSYPITNPPIFDSTMLIPLASDGVPRRRRISISNGQIGQIINHEAYFDGDDDMNGNLDDDLHFISGNRFNEFEFTRPHSSTTLGDIGQGLLIPSPLAQTQDPTVEIPAVAGATPGLITTVPVPVPQPKQQQAIPVVVSPPAGPDVAQQQVQPPPPSIPQQKITKNKAQYAGVPPPNHQLIYNNEVIYNPNNGPIPGTAAWKKERLLERNRIAASKCRQRKKQAQMELQVSIDKLEAKLKARDLKIEKLQATLKLYNKALLNHFESGDGDLFELKEIIEQTESLLN
ncbi:ATF/CREB activator 2 [Spathaspora sp. JA1]|nr:ATF/CREB activator 2 [Spathaspora sp. JA1]